MQGFKLKYILETIKYQKEKVLANASLHVQLLVNSGLLKSGSHIYLKFDRVFNLLFHK